MAEGYRRRGGVSAVAYEIRVQGHIGTAWSRWFDDLSVEELGDGTTRLSGHMRDQAALHGVLNKVRDLGLTLISVQRLEATPPELCPIS
jgi:hypothetical protein